MPDSFIKLWRSSLESDIWANHNVWRFWTWCLLKATYKEYDQLVGYQKVPLMPGQFVFGRLKASEETGLSERKIRTCLQTLVNTGNLTNKTTNKYSIITVVKWMDYQGQTTSKLTNKRPTNDQQTTTNKNIKELKEKNIYGEFRNVLLSDGEYQKLKDQFNATHMEKIETLSEYIASKGKKYNSHYATILSWSRKEGIHKDTNDEKPRTW